MVNLNTWHHGCSWLVRKSVGVENDDRSVFDMQVFIRSYSHVKDVRTSVINNGK